MATYRTATLGCKVNQYETRAVEEVLERAGWMPAAEGEPADLVLVNTCVVTAEAARQSRQTIRRLRRRQPAARIIVTGCYVTGPGREELEALEGLSLVVGDKDALRRRLASELGAEGGPTRGIRRFRGHARAFVKIQDGCDQFCTYCIVPLTRPRMVSRPPDEVVEEVRRLHEAGHREVVLCGVHLGRYGKDLGRTEALPSLVERLVELPDPGRLRLSSIEAVEVTPRLVETMAAHRPRVCPHLHLPLQSGDDDVLRAMGRPYTAAQFLDRVDRARQRMPDLAVSCDVMVGFPGESAAAFKRTCEVVRRARVGRLHVFRYSPRPGTRAASLPNPVPPAEARARAEHLRSLGHELASEFAAGLVGARVRVLVEQSGGRAGSDASAGAEGLDEHYLRTRLDAEAGVPARRGELVAARVTGHRRGGLLARVAEA